MLQAQMIPVTELITGFYSPHFSQRCRMELDVLQANGVSFVPYLHDILTGACQEVSSQSLES